MVCHHIYLFIIYAAEILILPITIRSRAVIPCLKIGLEEFKIVQYVDDLTMFVPNLESAQLCFSAAQDISQLALV